MILDTIIRFRTLSSDFGHFSPILDTIVVYRLTLEAGVRIGHNWSILNTIFRFWKLLSSVVYILSSDFGHYRPINTLIDLAHHCPILDIAVQFWTLSNFGR